MKNFGSVNQREACDCLAALADPAGVDPGRIGRRRFQIAPLLLFQLAEAHGVLPIVVRNYRQIRQDAAPPAGNLPAGSETAMQAAFDWAEKKLRTRLVQSMVLRKQCDQIDRRFRTAGIPGLVLKGEDFADHLYPSPSLRFFTDLDLLIPIDYAKRAGAILSELGYVPTDVSWQKHPDRVYGEEVWKHHDSSAPFGCVELHWNLVNSPSLRRSVSIDWDDLAPTDVPQDGGLHRPDFNARLLITAVHAAVGHNFDRLTLLCDFLQAVRLGADRWDTARLAEQIERTGAVRSIQMTGHLVRKVFEDDQADSALRRLDLPPADFASRWLIDRSVVLGRATPLRTLRRKLFRQRLKKAG